MSVKLTHTMLKLVLKSTSFSAKSSEFEEIYHTFRGVSHIAWGGEALEKDAYQVVSGIVDKPR